MRTHYLHSADEFLKAAGADLLADEKRHGLAYGIAERVAQDPQAFGHDAPWFLLAEDAAGLCGTALRTPPHRVVLSHFRGDLDTVCTALTHSVHSRSAWIPGVVAEKALADQFTHDWCAAWDTRVRDVMAQRIYVLTEVITPRFAPGALREASIADAELVAAWSAAFQKEAVGDEPIPTCPELQAERILRGGIYLWEDRVPVSMAVSTRPTRKGISVGGVYTPPEHRNHGYATSCVASLCARLLREREFCVLYTDLSNPVSNSIYKRIGFKEYCDSAQYSYDE